MHWLLQDAVAVWDHKMVMVYKIDSLDGRMSIELVGSFSSNSHFVCLFGLNVYTVELSRIHVRNFQVDDPVTPLMPTQPPILYGTGN